MVFNYLNTGIVGLNTAQGMNVCLFFFYVVLSCVSSGLVMG
jgi:hypothetical protein